MVSLNDLISEEIGAPVRPVIDPEITQVGTTVLRLLRNDPNRVGWLLVNLSANAIFILHNETVSSTTGIRVAPNGGSINFEWRNDYHWLGWEWFIVSDVASSGILTIALVTN